MESTSKNGPPVPETHNTSRVPPKGRPPVPETQKKTVRENGQFLFEHDASKHDWLIIGHECHP